MGLQIYGLVRGADGSKSSVSPANITREYICCIEMTGMFVDRDGGLWLEDGSGYLLKLRQDPNEETVVTDAVSYTPRYYSKDIDWILLARRSGLDTAAKHGLDLGFTLTPEEESRAPGEFNKFVEYMDREFGRKPCGASKR
ncbi:hypothetical protein Cantr_07426 [Candida viswanathii]|uniref:Uncharacterized protein n=1 Tax=Candida viswanathii TaxID=5486 RepID=A0A367XZH0_9ASCO|nr:hypothetical protein Cantr_07426 [Candida viswanathii]